MKRGTILSAESWGTVVRHPSGPRTPPEGASVTSTKSENDSCCRLYGLGQVKFQQSDRGYQGLVGPLLVIVAVTSSGRGGSIGVGHARTTVPTSRGSTHCRAWRLRVDRV